jgi:hypothetical protein
MIADESMNLQIIYTRFVEFAKKKVIRNKNLIDILNKRAITE